MMPFLGIRVQTYKQDSYSENQKKIEIKHRGNIYLPTKCGCKELVDAQNPTILFGEFLKNTHSFGRFFARPRGLQLQVAGGLNPWGDTHRFMCAPVFAKGIRIDTRTCYIIHIYCSNSFLEQPINTRHLSTLGLVDRKSVGTPNGKYPVSRAFSNQHDIHALICKIKCTHVK